MVERVEAGCQGRIARREWLRACARAGLALAVPVFGCAQAAGLPDSRNLVSTPAKRAEYLKKMLQVLCAELGPRPACSEACEAGVRGAVRKAGQQAGYFELVDRPDGRVLARIFPGPFGPAVTTRYRGDDGIPHFSLGRQDVPLLERAARESLLVFAKAPVKRIPNCLTSNVAGTLPGASTDEVLYVAHADTVYNGPGASDNTASVIAMLMLAHAISGTRPKRTFTFLASTAEEMGSLGAAHYAQTRNANGTLGRVKICVNLDSLTYGPNLHITTTDRELERMILDIHRDLGIRSEPKVFRRDDTMDSAPFKAAGVPRRDVL